MDQHRSASTVLAFALLLSLAGCGGVPGGPAPAASPAPDAQTPEAATAETAVQPFALDGTLTGAGVHSGYGNQDGFYTVRYAADGTANVMFVDYAAGVETYLCASPNCTHDSEACTSWCGCPANIPDVFPAGDRLVWVYLGNPEYVDEYGDAARCRIEVSGLDGAGRKNVQLLAPRWQLLYGNICVGQDAVFALASAFRQETDGVVQERCLLRIPLDGSEVQQLASFSESEATGYELAGGGDGTLYLVRTDVSEEFRQKLEALANGTATPDPETGLLYSSQAAWASSTRHLLALHGSGTLTDTGLQWGTDTEYWLEGRRLLLLTDGDGELSLRTAALDTGRETQLTVDAAPMAHPFAESTDTLTLCAMAGGRLIVQQKVLDQQSAETESRLLAIDCETGRCSVLPAWTGPDGQPPMVAAGTGQYLLLTRKGAGAFYLADMTQALAGEPGLRTVTPVEQTTG